MAKRLIQKLAHRMRFAGRYHIIIRRVRLQYAPHCARVFFGVPPVSFRIEIAKSQLIALPKLDPGCMRSNLARHEFESTPRALMVKENSRRSVNLISLAVVSGKVKPGHFRYAIDRTGVEPCAFGLRSLLGIPKHLAGPRKVESSSGYGIAQRG